MWVLGLLGALCVGLVVASTGVRLVLVSAVVLICARNLVRQRERSLLRREAGRPLSYADMRRTADAVPFTRARSDDRSIAAASATGRVVTVGESSRHRHAV